MNIKYKIKNDEILLLFRIKRSYTISLLHRLYFVA